MTPERWRQIEDLFASASARPAHERAAFLDSVCNGDGSLRCEVEELLKFDRGDGADVEEIVSAAAADWQEGSEREDLLGQTLGRYRILAPLGSGGMGDVFLAQDTMLDRKVALKLLPRRFTQDAERLRRFEQEARAASALNHPNIITIHEIGECDGTRFIATEFVEGETLADIIGQRNCSLGEILDIGCQAASALAAAHDAGIVHRDIKPANIMLRKDGFIKVLDFGLAKLISARAHLEATEAGRVMGTINYMSPEQALGQPLDHRTDIFSLGVVLYELATGRRLFAAESEAAVYDSILNKEAPPIREFAPTAPVELDHVVQHALNKKRERRYQTAAGLRADLQRLARGNETTEAARIARDEQRAARKASLWRIALAAAVVLGISAALFFGGRFAGENAGSPNESSRSIAVLPFEDLSGGDADKSYFTEAVHDQVLTTLVKIADLKVIGRASVGHYTPGVARNLREIGQQLGVNYLLEATVQRAAGNVRVNAQLSDVATEAQVWADSYDLPLADVLAIQTQIATRIAQQLHAKLSAAERREIARKPTSDLTALELETRGRALIDEADSKTEETEENLLAAVDVLNRAVQRDASFLAAYRQLERADDGLYANGIEHTPARLAMGQAAVDAMLRLAPDAGLTHLALATHIYAQREYERAEQALTAARATLPNDPDVIALSAYIHRRLGNWDSSTRELQRAVDLDPRNADLLKQLSANYHATNNFSAYAGVMERLIAIAPDQLPPRLARASADLLWFANTRPLHALVDEALKANPASASSLAQTMLMLAFDERDLPGIEAGISALGDRYYGNDNERFSRAFCEGMLARMKGDRAAAQRYFLAAREAQLRVVEAQPNYGPPVSVLGIIDAMLGRKDEALAEGRRGVELTPTAKDSMIGPAMVTHLAIIASWVGENDLAIEQLQSVVHRPAAPQYGLLKLDPLWDALRDDPRFQEILASLAPSDSNS